MSPNSYVPFLKIVEPENVDYSRKGERAKIGNSHYLRCIPDGFEFTDKDDEPVIRITVAQDANGIDTEERVEKYNQESAAFIKQIKIVEAED